jgi:hypothetical protein
VTYQSDAARYKGGRPRTVNLRRIVDALLTSGARLTAAMRRSYGVGDSHTKERPHDYGRVYHRSVLAGRP